MEIGLEFSSQCCCMKKSGILCVRFSDDHYIFRILLLFSSQETYRVSVCCFFQFKYLSTSECYLTYLPIKFTRSWVTWMGVVKISPILFVSNLCGRVVRVVGMEGMCNSCINIFANSAVIQINYSVGSIV